MPRRTGLTLCTSIAAALATAVSAFASQSPAADPTVAAKHDVDPIILTGADFPAWSARSNVTAKAPLTDLQECAGTVDPSQSSDPNDWLVADSDCQHNSYSKPEVDTGNALGDGTPVDRLAGYRWNAKAKRFTPIPFQVDEMFTRYLNNSASGFALYSGEDQHTTYAFDREGFRMRKEASDNPCLALPDSPTATDPVKGLDDNDELVFMASDAGPQAPAGASLPKGAEAAREVRVTDPQNPGAATYAYVMKLRAPADAASEGYVDYERDADADLFQYSQSNYDSYGNAPKGHFMWNGECRGAADTPENRERCKGAPDSPQADPGAMERFLSCPQRHRPGDAATITTPRYKFRYDGRWLLTGLQIWDKSLGDYGPDLIDRWKARAFAQDPYSETPCCGYEDEDKNWGGSSNLIGEKAGPVRVIRETWGADSGTNVIRRETFYRETMRQKSFLRVHVIPPADGIYAQWDFNAGKVTRYYNPRNEAGVPVDGRNDEQVGNFDDPCNSIWDGNERSVFDQTYRDMYKQMQFCTPPCDPVFGSGQCLPLNRYHLSMDVTDPTFNNLNATLDWHEVAGPYGTVVDRYQLDRVTDLNPGGGAQSVFAVPYYRDDACFDDGTGSDPGPRLLPRSDREPREGRRCWKPSDGDPNSDPKYFQGDIGTHGMHLLLIAESDNGRQTMPLTEIVAEQRMVFLPGDQGNVGEQYGRSFEKPLLALATDYSGSQPSKPGKGPKAGSNGGTVGGSAFLTPPKRVKAPKRSGRERRRAVTFDDGKMRVVTLKARR